MPMQQPGSTEKPGDMKFCAANAIPPGWVKANGAALSRTAYAALFAAIGTTYGAGDGVSTFNVPDARGRHIRAWDDGAGNDPGRAFGTYQGDSFASHGHIHGLSGTNVAGDAGRYGITDTGVAATYMSMVSGSDGRSHNTSSTGGTETRPKNVAMLAVIKY